MAAAPPTQQNLQASCSVMKQWILRNKEMGAGVGGRGGIIWHSWKNGDIALGRQMHSYAKANVGL